MLSWGISVALVDYTISNCWQWCICVADSSTSLMTLNQILVCYPLFMSYWFPKMCSHMSFVQYSCLQHFSPGWVTSSSKKWIFVLLQVGIWLEVYCKNTLILLHFNFAVLTFRNLHHFYFPHFYSLTFWQLVTVFHKLVYECRYPIFYAVSDKY